MAVKSSKMERWVICLGLAACATLTLTVSAVRTQPAFPQSGGPRGGRMAAGMLPGLRQLDMTDAQRDQVQSIVSESREASQPLTDQLMTTRRALNDAVTAEVVNEGGIRALAGQLATLEGDLAVARAYVNAQIWQLLTPDQQAQLRELKADAEERIDQRRQRMEERRQRSG